MNRTKSESDHGSQNRKRERTARKDADLKEATTAVFYKAFRSMDSVGRRRLAMRILKDEELCQDLYKHFLIQHEEKEETHITRREQYLKQRDMAIRALRSDGWTIPKIAAKVGMHKASVSRILRHKQAIVAEGIVPRNINRAILPRQRGNH